MTRSARPAHLMHDYRQRRLAENGAAMSSFEWLVLIVGAGCVIGFCWLFGLENESVHLIMTSAVAIVLSATLVLLFELQYPFQSDLRIQPDDWNAVVAHIKYMQSGPQAAMRMEEPETVDSLGPIKWESTAPSTPS